MSMHTTNSYFHQDGSSAIDRPRCGCGEGSSRLRRAKIKSSTATRTMSIVLTAPCLLAILSMAFAVAPHALSLSNLPIALVASSFRNTVQKKWTGEHSSRIQPKNAAHEKRRLNGTAAACGLNAPADTVNVGRPVVSTSGGSTGGSSPIVVSFPHFGHFTMRPELAEIPASNPQCWHLNNMGLGI